MKPYPFLTLNHFTVPKTFVAGKQSKTTLDYQPSFTTAPRRARPPDSPFSPEPSSRQGRGTALAVHVGALRAAGRPWAGPGRGPKLGVSAGPGRGAREGRGGRPAHSGLRRRRAAPSGHSRKRAGWGTNNGVRDERTRPAADRSAGGTRRTRGRRRAAVGGGARGRRGVLKGRGDSVHAPAGPARASGAWGRGGRAPQSRSRRPRAPARPESANGSVARLPPGPTPVPPSSPHR
jgi:hypothetical protein